MTRVTTLDLQSLARMAVGFDRMFDDIIQIAANGNATNYPPYNLVQLGNNEYAVEVAVAGFSESELSVESAIGRLTISGHKDPDVKTKATYLYQGISNRSFVRTIPLAENIRVVNASVNNGLLIVTLKEIVPEEHKVTKIPITVAN